MLHQIDLNIYIHFCLPQRKIWYKKIKIKVNKLFSFYDYAVFHKISTFDLGLIILPFNLNSKYN